MTFFWNLLAMDEATLYTAFHTFLKLKNSNTVFTLKNESI